MKLLCVKRPKFARLSKSRSLEYYSSGPCSLRGGSPSAVSCRIHQGRVRRISILGELSVTLCSAASKIPKYLNHPCAPNRQLRSLELALHSIPEGDISALLLQPRVGLPRFLNNGSRGSTYVIAKDMRHNMSLDERIADRTKRLVLGRHRAQ